MGAVMWAGEMGCLRSLHGEREEKAMGTQGLFYIPAEKRDVAV